MAESKLDRVLVHWNWCLLKVSPKDWGDGGVSEYPAGSLEPTLFLWELLWTT